MNVIKAVTLVILSGDRVTSPISWIRKCPAVILAVSHTAKAMGWINRLIVSIITRMGIKGREIICDKNWASEAFVL